MFALSAVSARQFQLPDALFCALSDDELMDVYINGNLTEDATSVLERELDIRGLTSKNITQRENQKKIEDFQSMQFYMKF